MRYLGRFLFACSLVAGCGGAPLDETVPPAELGELGEPLGKADSPGSGWTSVGLGVSYQRQGPGDAVLIAYGGYSARLGYSEAWATELRRAKLEAYGVGHVYAVQGPRDPGYAALEIANSKLGRHLAGGIAEQAPFIMVVAHSSGAFVAHELLRQLHGAGRTDTLGKIVYADLDGGGSGLTRDIAASLRRLLFVYAEDEGLRSGLSANAGAILSLGRSYGPYGAAFRVAVTRSGCASGARWCLHDLVITHRPHDPQRFDLRRDYSDFEDRPVTTEYLDELSGDFAPR